MSVKVQCSECQKSLKVPETARGKVLKCPGCGAKVKIPGGAEGDNKPRGKNLPAPDSGEILATLDLKKAVDEDASICPQCGKDVYEDDEECGSCGFELAFGSVREAKRAALEGRKTDLRPFYAKMVGDAWEFSKVHMGFIVSTWGIFIFAACMVIICGHLAYWCATWPTKSFWSFFGIVCGVVPLGWTWHFHTHIIRLTARKKSKIDKLPFDFAHASMAGLTAVAWFVVFSLPLLLTLGLVGAYFTFLADIPWAFPASVVLIAFMITPMLPQVMSHQAMPITYRGWLMTEIFKSFGISLTPALYWWFMAGISYLLPAILMGGIIFFSLGSLESYKKNFDDYTNLHGATVRVALKEKDKSKKNDVVKEDPLEAAYLELKPEPYKWHALLLPMTGVVICSFLVSFAAVFNARSNGLYTYYLKNDLNLIQHVTERKYVKKEVQDIEFSMKRSQPCPNGTRFMAQFIDNMIIGLICSLLYGLLIFILISLQITDPKVVIIISCVLCLVLIAVQFMYYISGYASPTRTTPGRQIFNVYLATEKGEEVSPTTVLIRQLVKEPVSITATILILTTLILSISGLVSFDTNDNIILVNEGLNLTIRATLGIIQLAALLYMLINYMVMANRQDRRGWHDLAAGTVVRQRKKPKVKKKKDDEADEEVKK